MWDLLEVTYEGTYQVKESKISMLVHEYELFFMHDNECISDMFTRFTTIVNSLKNLGKSYSNQELVRKILRCLPRSWTPKCQKGKKAFKKKFPQEEESSKKEGPTCYECKKPGHFKNECPNLKKKEKFNKEQFKKKNEQSKKKKAMVATWDDSDPSSSEEEESDEEVVNLALMAVKEDASEDESDNEVQFSFDELQNAYEKLYVEYENVCLKNKTLKKNVISMSKEIDNLKNKNSKYINEIESLKSKNSFYMNEIEVLNVSSKFSNDSMEENEKLKIEIDALKKSFSIFSNNSAKLDNLLGLQMCVFDKAGLGY
ncbi:zf-CCHC domain-containing protein/UBN2 domain-containing protein [Cephalotus follicularis]|uniref:Zf-CCHC domain-containing protein/UBN2 domain-containing protein n=1 Tax=Cephalotus follicularis TaxID=3775 RepID=A0A1Q3CTT3_CEPFO|nr:zf-CCHC domain-containing protein/UBN2 domain-containing protein [Cephalotus follicularis]